MGNFFMSFLEMELCKFLEIMGNFVGFLEMGGIFVNFFRS
jgi:hypothetical protein